MGHSSVFPIYGAYFSVTIQFTTWLFSNSETGNNIFHSSATDSLLGKSQVVN